MGKACVIFLGPTSLFIPPLPLIPLALPLTVFVRIFSKAFLVKFLFLLPRGLLLPRKTLLFDVVADFEGIGADDGPGAGDGLGVGNGFGASVEVSFSAGSLCSSKISIPVWTTDSIFQHF